MRLTSYCQVDVRLVIGVALELKAARHGLDRSTQSFNMREKGVHEVRRQERELIPNGRAEQHISKFA
jgi:hypothetical protein